MKPKNHLWYFCFLFLLLFMCFVLSSCELLETKIVESNEYVMGFDKEAYKIILEEDTHDGFHGDGSYVLVLNCSKNRAEALKIVESWEHLPFTDSLNQYIYGVEGEGYSYHGEVAEKVHLPRIQNGYYRFENHNENGLLSVFEQNFALGVYDFDTDTFYYYELDT